jgi:subfamily B ATP-binding cassette protein HlyB/CyaB
MTEHKVEEPPSFALDRGLVALCQVAAYYHVAADPLQLRHQLALSGRAAQSDDVVRAAKLLQLKARILHAPSERRLKQIPLPALVKLRDAGFALVAARSDDGEMRLVDPLTRLSRVLTYAELAAEWSGEVVLIARGHGVGVDPKRFGLNWFMPSLWRYRHPLAQVLLASLFVQLFALIMPLFFQIVVDKVLVH